MGVKVRHLRGFWWIVVHHNGRRKKKRIGRDKETAERVARALREKLVRGELRLERAFRRKDARHIRQGLAHDRQELVESEHVRLL